MTHRIYRTYIVEKIQYNTKNDYSYKINVQLFVQIFILYE